MPEGRRDDVPVFVVARMSSVRLPGKTLRVLGNLPMLNHVTDAMTHCSGAFRVYVVTSVDRSDDAIEQWCDEVGLVTIRGPLEDVSRRLLLAAEGLGAPAFVRISADSPLIDPQIVDHAVSLFCDDQVDLVTNTFPRTFPRGQSVEVIATGSLGEAVRAGMSQQEQEHVTRVFYDNAIAYQIRNFVASDLRSTPSDMDDLSLVHLGVDDLADLERCERVLLALGSDPPWHAGWVKCVAAEHSVSRFTAFGPSDV